MSENIDETKELKIEVLDSDNVLKPVSDSTAVATAENITYDTNDEFDSEKLDEETVEQMLENRFTPKKKPSTAKKGTGNSKRKKKGRHIALNILIIFLAAILVFVIFFVGAYIFFGDNQPETGGSAPSHAVNQKENDNGNDNENSSIYDEGTSGKINTNPDKEDEEETTVPEEEEKEEKEEKKPTTPKKPNNQKSEDDSEADDKKKTDTTEKKPSEEKDEDDTPAATDKNNSDEDTDTQKKDEEAPKQDPPKEQPKDNGNNSSDSNNEGGSAGIILE